MKWEKSATKRIFDQLQAEKITFATFWRSLKDALSVTNISLFHII
jgi:hypothetical protein